MILVDTSVWVDHLRRGDAQLVDLLKRAKVVMHPFVVGEIACGSLGDRSSVLDLLQDLPAASVAENEEVLGFIEHRSQQVCIDIADALAVQALAFDEPKHFFVLGH